MKDKFSTIGAVLILLAGIALIWFHATLAVATIVLIVGLIFIVPSVINIIIYLVQSRVTTADEEAEKQGQKPSRQRSSNLFGWLSSIAGIILGLAMIIFTSDFVGLLAFVFGIMLALCALFHFFVMAISYKKVDFSPALYILPIALVGLSIACFCLTPAIHDATLILLAGIGLCIFAVTIFCENTYTHRHRVRLRRIAQLEQQLEEEKEKEPKPLTSLPDHEEDK